MKWFRFYHEVIDDPKVQRLSPELFKSWVNLLCIAARNNGEIPCDMSSLSFSMRLTESKLSSHIESLITADLLDNTNGLKPHNWSSRQYESDDVNARVKRFREKNRTSACNVSPPIHATPPDTDTDTDTEQKEESIGAEAPSRTRTTKANDGRARELSPDWKPDDDDSQYALARGIDPTEYLQSFIDYWCHECPKPKRKKASWSRTWRRSIDREADYRARFGRSRRMDNGQKPASLATAVGNVLARLETE